MSAAGNDTVVPAKSTGKDERKAKAPQEPALKCPRCDSPNTKFCYYNNYSLSQPRHFCKTCRRYWTRGGALRNVPIGGGCRKTKKIKSSCHSVGSSDHVGAGFKLFQGITSSPAMDFQLGGFPARLQQDYTTGLLNQFSSPGDISNLCFGSLSSSPLNQGGTVNSNLTSSIETLSSINQDLHWKLQQQRLAMLFVDDNSRKLESSGGGVSSSSKQEAAGGIIGSSTNLSTEWFFDNSYAPVSPILPNGSDGNANEAPWSCNMNQYGAFS